VNVGVIGSTLFFKIDAFCVKMTSQILLPLCRSSIAPSLNQNACFATEDFSAFVWGDPDVNKTITFATPIASYPRHRDVPFWRLSKTHKTENRVSPHRSKFDMLPLPAGAYVNITRAVSVFRRQNRKSIELLSHTMLLYLGNMINSCHSAFLFLLLLLAGIASFKKKRILCLYTNN